MRGKMNVENLLYLPRKTKAAALLVLIFSLIFSASITIYYLFFIDAESTFILAALSVFQITSTGAAIALVAFSAKSSFGREALLNQTSQWLTKDFVAALETIDLPFDPDSSSWSPTKVIDEFTKVDVLVDHIEGTSSAFYEISAFDVRLMMRVTLNSYRFIVLIYVKDNLEKCLNDFGTALEAVTLGAENVGFETRLMKNPAPWAPASILYEAYFFKDVAKDFLYDGIERLFWAQDIATLTRSAIIQLKRNSWI
jgi:hypothetical protein